MAGGLSCRFWEDELGRSHGACVGIVDTDVVGHASAPERTATISVSWREDPSGERHVEFTSDDSEAQAVLMDLLKLAGGDRADQPASAR